MVDWIYLGFYDSYSKHPRVLTETISQILFIYSIYMLSGKGTINVLFQQVEAVDPTTLPPNWKALI